MILRFERTVPPPDVSGGYAAFRPYVRADFQQCCAYCCLHEFWAGGVGNFELDHYRPVSRFPHLVRDFYNLRYACHVCNLTKQEPTRFLHRNACTLQDSCLFSANLSLLKSNDKEIVLCPSRLP